MAVQNKSKKQINPRDLEAQKYRQSTSPKAMPPRQQSKVRRVFTVIICVIVALGLMLPATGLGVISCFGGF